MSIDYVQVISVMRMLNSFKVLLVSNLLKQLFWETMIPGILKNKTEPTTNHKAPIFLPQNQSLNSKYHEKQTEVSINLTKPKYPNAKILSIQRKLIQTHGCKQ